MMMILRNRSLLIMASAEAVSLVGNWIAMQAIYSLLIFQQGGGVAQSAGIYLAGMGPTLLLSPVAGWLCDRIDRRILMIISELLSGLIIAGLIFTTRIEWLYLLMALASAAGVVMSPARSTVVPDVVAPQDLTRANAFMVQVNSIARVGAPLIAAVVVAAVSPQTALLLDVLSFLLSAVLLTRLPKLPPRAERRPAVAEQSGQPRPSFLQTLSALLRQMPIIRLVLPFFFLLGWTLISFDITLSVVVRDIMLGGVGMTGMLASAVGLGMGLASLALMLSRRARRVEWDYLAGLALIACLPAAITLGEMAGSPTLARVFIFAGCLLGGLGIGLANVQGQTLLQRLAPDGWLGRMTGAFTSISLTGQLLGMFLTPLLVPGVVSFGVYFGVATALLGLLCLRTLVALSRAGAVRPYVVNEVANGD